MYSKYFVQKIEPSYSSDRRCDANPAPFHVCVHVYTYPQRINKLYFGHTICLRL
jgi:hypothetical protein